MAVTIQLLPGQRTPAKPGSVSGASEAGRSFDPDLHLHRRHLRRLPPAEVHPKPDGDRDQRAGSGESLSYRLVPDRGAIIRG